jgi:hypothetical protein
LRCIGVSRQSAYFMRSTRERGVRLKSALIIRGQVKSGRDKGTAHHATLLGTTSLFCCLASALHELCGLSLTKKNEEVLPCLPCVSGVFPANRKSTGVEEPPRRFGGCAFEMTNENYQRHTNGKRSHCFRKLLALKLWIAMGLLDN